MRARASPYGRRPAPARPADAAQSSWSLLARAAIVAHTLGAPYKVRQAILDWLTVIDTTHTTRDGVTNRLTYFAPG